MGYFDFKPQYRREMESNRQAKDSVINKHKLTKSIRSESRLRKMSEPKKARLLKLIQSGEVSKKSVCMLYGIDYQQLKSELKV